MKSRPIAALAVALLALAAVPAMGQDDAAAGPERFNGTWRYNGSAASGQRIIERQVERTVAPMNIFIRAIAAGRLRGKNQLVRRIEINVANDNARIVFDGSRTYRTGLGQWRNHTFDGDQLRVQIRERNGSLVQLFRSDGGSRRNIYSILPDGNMRLQVTVQSDQLPRDMTYRLTYRR